MSACVQLGLLLLYYGGRKGFPERLLAMGKRFLPEIPHDTKRLREMTGRRRKPQSLQITERRELSMKDCSSGNRVCGIVHMPVPAVSNHEVTAVDVIPEKGRIVTKGEITLSRIKSNEEYLWQAAGCDYGNYPGRRGWLTRMRSL